MPGYRAPASHRTARLAVALYAAACLAVCGAAAATAQKATPATAHRFNLARYR